MDSCVIIGISDSARPALPPEARDEIGRGTVFSGGERHRRLIGGLLPEGSRWITITPPMERVFEAYEGEGHVVIFASGDPLFYGFAATVRRMLPGCRVRVIPSFHSLQLLAHRLCLPYAEMRNVSLTGRGWEALDEALLMGEPLIGCLTDTVKTPHAIRERMLAYGFDNYELLVGERLGNEEHERVGVYREGESYACPNCLIARMTKPRPRRFGLPDNEFALLDGREAMITKMPVRLTTLSALGLGGRESLWDVGYCTGSVSIEARLAFPRVRVTAFERRGECEALLEENTRRFGAPGIRGVMGDFLEVDTSTLPRPDAVFIGGHGGRLAEMMRRISSELTPGGRVVFNSVTEGSRRDFLLSAEATGMRAGEFHRVRVDGHNEICVMTADKPL